MALKKTYLNFPGLQEYDILIKDYINKKAISSISEELIADLFKSPGNITLSKTSAIIKTNEADTVTISDATGPVTVKSSDPEIATAVLNDDTITITGVNPGSISITVQVAATDTYYAVNKTINVIIEQSIQIITTIPSQKGILTYNTNLQSPEWNNYDVNQLVLSGEENGIDARTYTATFTPKQGYCWNDSSVDTKSVEWTIDKANGDIILSSNSVELSEDNPSVEVTFSENTGDVTVTSDDENIATASIDGNVITIKKLSRIPLTDIVTSSKLINSDNPIIIYDPDTKDYADNVIEWQVIGKDQDGANTITVQTKTLVGDGASEYGNKIGDRRYDSSRNILNSELQDWLDNDFYNHLGSDFRSKIISITKSITPYQSGDITSKECKLFNLSVAEVGGGSDTYYSPETGAFTYQYYQGINSTSSNTKRVRVHSDGSRSCWWLRSPYADNSSIVWLVGSGGSLGYGYSVNGKSLGPAPACVLPSDIKLEEDANGKYKIVW